MGDDAARASGIITSMRKSGRLDEALGLARREHARHPGDERVSRALSWVLCDLVRRDGASPRLAEHLRGIAELRLPDDGNEVLYKNLLRRLTDLAWDLRRAHDERGLRALLDSLRSATVVVPDAEWLAGGRSRSDGERVLISTSEAGPLLRPLFSAFSGSPEELESLVSWSGPEPFVMAEDLRHGTWEAPDEEGETPEALDDLPRTTIYVEWASPRRGALGITAYRRSAVREFGAPQVSIERSVVHDARLARELRAHEVYDAVLSPDGRSVLGTPEVCGDEALRSVFVRRFEGRFERVGDYGFVRLPGGTASTGDVLVPARTVAELGIADLSMLSGVAVASYREDEDAWGFVADSVERVEPPRPDDVERRVTGTVRVSRGGSAFVGDCLVPERLMGELGLRDGQEASVRARLRWDRRRRTWDWIAVSA